MAAHSSMSAATDLDDVTLVRAVRGDEPARRLLVERYERPVFALLGRMLSRRRDVVEDLAQETFLRVFRALPSFDRAGPARLGTWILTIATRVAFDELKRKRLERVPLDDEISTKDDPIERRAIGRAIERAVAALSPDHRAVFLLREYHGLGYEELARALEIDIGTVKSRLARARAALQAALDEVKP
jgi:RNA polymerase sigma-70 factor (ECF subfamily)